jgi:macrolide transport system ATP-binding/permease protein
MEQQGILFHNVSFSYDTSIQLFEDLSVSFNRGWTGIVGVNGVGKTTLVKLAAGVLKPHRGRIDRTDEALYCPQRTDDIPLMLEKFLAERDALACRLQGALDIESDWRERWETLSHGERKRAQIAIALWRQPLLLAVDEPTNHIDLDARMMLQGALQDFRGVGLIISHDRELLDSLCSQCLFIRPPHIVMRPGGVTRGLEEEQREDAHRMKQHRMLKASYRRMKREAGRRKELADRQQAMRSKRGLSIRDHDARSKKDLARVSGKDGVGGKLLRQLDGRLKHLQQRIESVQVRKTYTLGIWLDGSSSRKDLLFTVRADNLSLGEGGSLRIPELVMKPTDRIALTGPNGSGKSTLIRHIVATLNLPGERLVYLPQEIPLESSQALLDEVRNLPNEELGHLMTIISRLGSRPDRLLESVEPSPGETRKLLLALGVVRSPHLIVMDEPTNHLDIDSINCLEEALMECPCGILLVSHDSRFLNALTDIRWEIGQQKPGEYRLQVL